MKSKCLFISLCITILITNKIYAQKKFVEVGVGLGKGSFSPVVGVNKNYYLGKKDKIVVGYGLRYTGFLGKQIYFTSAPNALAIDLTKTDSLYAPSPSIHALNLLINLGYKINDKFQVGFNIDAVGASFGPEGTPKFVSNGKETATTAKPTAVNVLLVGNKDKGSLNSLLYLQMNVNQKISVRLAYQLLFNELTTSTKIQTVPEANDRFRVKSRQGFVGVNVNF